MNHWAGIGRLTREPEMRFTQSGTPVTSFTLAVDRIGKEKAVDFIDVVAWNKTAELCANYLSKGKMACVEGRLEIQNYEAQDGSKRKAAKIIANNVTFLSPKSEQPAKEPGDAGDERPF
jgi:single-strand DNA-binding protein